MERFLITGLSGAGKTKAVNALEDMGFYCVHNLPPQLLARFTQLRGDSAESTAVVLDTRGEEAFAQALDALETLKEEGIEYKILFLDADTQVLRQRYKETRRMHPMMEGHSMTLEEAIEKERKIIEPLGAMAHLRIDTSKSSPAQLKEQLVSMLTGEQARRSMWIRCMSFGFKTGIPVDADLVFDVRCLLNPFYVAELKPFSGLDEPVRAYVMQHEQAQIMLEKLKDLLRFTVPLYRAEGRSQLVIAVGCTGGQHRSVAFAQALGMELKSQGHAVTILHRDMEQAMRQY